MDHSSHHQMHNKHAGHDPEVFRRQFWIVLLLTDPGRDLEPRGPGLARLHRADLPRLRLDPIGRRHDLVFLYGGKVFLEGARAELGDRQPGMMTLISLAIVVAFVASWAAPSASSTVDVWWELATLITVMSLGPLDRDALDHAGAGRAQRAGRAAAGQRRAGCARRPG